MEEGQAPEEQPELPVPGSAQGLTEQQPGQVPEAEGPQPGLPLFQIHAQSEQPQLGWNPPGPSWAGGDLLSEDAGTTGSGPPYTEIHAGVLDAIRGRQGQEREFHAAMFRIHAGQPGWHPDQQLLGTGAPLDLGAAAPAAQPGEDLEILQIVPYQWQQEQPAVLPPQGLQVFDMAQAQPAVVTVQPADLPVVAMDPLLQAEEQQEMRLFRERLPENPWANYTPGRAQPEPQPVAAQPAAQGASEQPGSSGPNYGPGVLLPGDWMCANCKEHVFGSRRVCPRCKQPPLEGVGVQQGGRVPHYQGQCPSCNIMLHEEDQGVCPRCEQQAAPGAAAGGAQPGTADQGPAGRGPPAGPPAFYGFPRPGHNAASDGFAAGLVRWCCAGLHPCGPTQGFDQAPLPTPGTLQPVLPAPRSFGARGLRVPFMDTWEVAALWSRDHRQVVGIVLGAVDRDGTTIFYVWQPLDLQPGGIQSLRFSLMPSWVGIEGLLSTGWREGGDRAPELPAARTRRRPVQPVPPKALSLWGDPQMHDSPNKDGARPANKAMPRPRPKQAQGAEAMAGPPPQPQPGSLPPAPAPTQKASSQPAQAAPTTHGSTRAPGPAPAVPIAGPHVALQPQPGTAEEEGATPTSPPPAQEQPGPAESPAPAAKAKEALPRADPEARGLQLGPGHQRHMRGASRPAKVLDAAYVAAYGTPAGRTSYGAPAHVAQPEAQEVPSVRCPCTDVRLSHPKEAAAAGQEEHRRRPFELDMEARARAPPPKAMGTASASSSAGDQEHPGDVVTDRAKAPPRTPAGTLYTHGRGAGTEDTPGYGQAGWRGALGTPEFRVGHREGLRNSQTCQHPTAYETILFPGKGRGHWRTAHQSPQPAASQPDPQIPQQQAGGVVAQMPQQQPAQVEEGMPKAAAPAEQPMGASPFGRGPGHSAMAAEKAGSGTSSSQPGPSQEEAPRADALATQAAPVSPFGRGVPSRASAAGSTATQPSVFAAPIRPAQLGHQHAGGQVREKTPPPSCPVPAQFKTEAKPRVREPPAQLLAGPEAVQPGAGEEQRPQTGDVGAPQAPVGPPWTPEQWERIRALQQRNLKSPLPQPGSQAAEATQQPQDTQRVEPVQQTEETDQGQEPPQLPQPELESSPEQGQGSEQPGEHTLLAQPEATLPEGQSAPQVFEILD